MPRPHHSTRAETRWAVRIIPLFIVAVLGVATYSVVARLCSKFDVMSAGDQSLLTLWMENQTCKMLTIIVSSSQLPLPQEAPVRRGHGVSRPLFSILSINGRGLSTNILYNPTEPGPRAPFLPRADRARSCREAAKTKTQTQPR